jgi:hypothetical protein
MKKKLFIILTIILACAGIVSGASYYGANSVAIDSNCNKSQYYPLGRLCQDKDDAKLYKGIGSAIEEIGSVTISPTTYANIIEIFPTAEVIPGKRYQTVLAAQAYLRGLINSSDLNAPSAINIWGIKIFGTYNENIDIGSIPYAHYLGEQPTTMLTGQITSTGGFNDMFENKFVVKNCTVNNLILGENSTGEFHNCIITGGTSAEYSIPQFSNCFIRGGTITSSTTGTHRPIIYYSIVTGGTFNGGIIYRSDIFSDVALNSGNYDFDYSSYYGNININSGHYLLSAHGGFMGNVTINSGGTLETYKNVLYTTGNIDRKPGGTWNKRDSHNTEFGDLQGGNATTLEYYHLTHSEHSNLTGGNIAANITGTAAGLSGTPSVSLNNLTVAGVASLTGAAITGGSGNGITVNSAGNVNRQVYKVTTTYQAYSDNADMTKGVVIATLPAKTKLLAAYADTTQAYTGTNITAANLVVGVSAENSAQILASHDVLTSTVTKGLDENDLGANMVRTALVQGGYFPSWTGSTDVYATINTVGANTDQLLTGITTFYLVTERF